MRHRGDVPTELHDKRRYSHGLDTYLLGWDHDTDLLNGLGELIGFDDTVSVEVKVLERFLEHLLLRGDA